MDHTPQFAILDYSKRKELIHEIRAKLLEKDIYHAIDVKSVLRRKGVIRTSAMIAEVPDDDGRCVRVSLRFSVKADGAVCSGKFWHVKTVHELVKWAKIREPINEQWKASYLL